MNPLSQDGLALGACVCGFKVRLGDLKEEHCLLFDAVDRLREASLIVETLWDESFEGLSDLEIFALLDEALSIGYVPGGDHCDRFDFLTNADEQFDDIKTFLICRAGAQVHVLYQFRDGTMDSGCCNVKSFRDTVEAFVSWFEQQVLSVGFVR